MNAATIRFASWRWMAAAAASLLVAVATALAVGQPGLSGTASPAPAPAFAPAGHPANLTPALGRLVERDPSRRVEVIVQLNRGAAPASARTTIKVLGGRVTRALPIINGFAATMTAAQAERVALEPPVYAVTLNGAVKSSGLLSGLLGDVDAEDLRAAYIASTRAHKVWKDATGRGVGVAVLDTGITGDLADFRASRSDNRSRVVASAVVNPDATTASDLYGHGTHVAGLIASNGFARNPSDSLYGKYVGAAPEANLVSVKVSDDHGATSVLDVILGLQFVVDHKDDLGIRVVNMSLNSSVAQSYKTDPIDAAAEAAWNSGLVVVTAAGNRGAADDAVNYAPANDPYVITVGGVDDMGTKKASDDELADWSSHGTTQDGLAKPDVLAPGAHVVSTLAPGSDFTSLCPDCVRDGQYFQVGGTSMAAAVVSGIVADLVQAQPDWTPNQVKGAIVNRARNVKGVGAEIDADDSMSAKKKDLASNSGLTRSSLIDPATGQIDYSRAGWSRAGWSDAAETLRAGWSRAGWSWACDCAPAPAEGTDDPADPARAGWSRAGWSRAGWATSFTK